MNSIPFQALPLAEPLQRALRERGYQTPSPIQREAIPHLLEGRDLLGVAQTGTGKTAAFALPILHRLHANPGPRPSNGFRVLVLTPTRELAAQVNESFETYGRYFKVSCATVYGGVSQASQVRALRRGVDVLVATPGRLLDLFSQRRLTFDAVEFLVLDEADRMLDMGFLPDIRRIIDQLPKERQSLFFSATLSSEIFRLAGGILVNPVHIRIAPEQRMAKNVDHQVCFLSKDKKFDLLKSMLEAQSGRDHPNRTIVFSRTKHGANRLASDLGKSGLRAEAIHGNKSQGARQRALDNFKRGGNGILVATDVASRGIDVKGITLVVNYDLPVEPEAYVHRIGRTARAEASGRAVSFCCSSTRGELSAIEKLLRMKIPVHAGHPYHEQGLVDPRARSAPRRKNGSARRTPRGQSKRFQSSRRHRC